MGGELPPPSKGVIVIGLESLDNGIENAELAEVLASLRSAGVSYDVTDSGSYEWDPGLSCWRPGMDEPVRRECNQSGTEVLDRDVVETILADFPDALDAIRKAYPTVPPLGQAPPALSAVELPI